MTQLNETDLRSDVLSCLSSINSNLARDEWLKVLTGIAGSGLHDSKQIAQEWSQTSESFNQSAFNSTWQSIDYSWCNNPVGLLFSIGKQSGFNVKNIKDHGQKKNRGAKPALKAVNPYTHPEKVRADFDRFGAYSGSDYLGSVKKIDGLVDTSLAKHLRTDVRGEYKNLVIPCYSIESGETTSYQTIFSNGDKPHPKGSQVKGSWFPLGSTDNNIFFLFESFADALVAFNSIKEGALCACIFSATSFKTAIAEIQNKYPDAQLVFFCDGDDAGVKVCQSCESLEGIAGYMSPDYGGSKKDAYDLWKHDKESFAKELKEISSYLGDFQS